MGKSIAVRNICLDGHKSSRAIIRFVEDIEMSRDIVAYVYVYLMNISIRYQRTSKGRPVKRSSPVPFNCFLSVLFAVSRVLSALRNPHEEAVVRD